MGKLANGFYKPSKSLIDSLKKLPKFNDEPRFIIDFIKKYGNVDQAVEPPDDRCKQALNHFYEEYKYYQKHDSTYARKFLLKREEKYLPFVMGDIGKDIKQIYFLYTIISQNKKDSMLKNEIQAYCSCYKENYAAVLAKDIIDKLSVYNGRNSRLKNYKKYDYIFTEEGFEKIYRCCCKYGFGIYLDKIHLSGILRYSSLVKDVLSKMFATDDKVFKVEKKYELYTSVMLSSIDEGAYSDIYDDIFSNFIISVDKYKKMDLRVRMIDSLRNELVKYYKDPRLSPRTWRGIKKEALETFKRWLSQRDLKLFFQIISDSYENADFTAKRMWAYRKVFWEAYLPHISNTWVLFGAEAEREIPENEVMEHGHFSNAKKSCIMMQIGKCIFIERSHNGRLKVWNRKSPFEIGIQDIDEKELVNSIPDDDWTHTCSENFSWQKSVSDFIMENCKIVKDIEEFKPKYY